MDAGECVLLLVVHHIAADFWALAVLVRELSALYRGEEIGEPPVRSYASHVAREQRRLAAAEGEALQEYWREALAEVRDLDLATDRPRPPVQTWRGASVPFALGPDLSARIAGLARDRRTTLSPTLLAAFEALLHRHTGRESFAVGAPTASRAAADFAGVVGYFVNLLPLRADLAGRPAFADLLARTAETVNGALAHQALPFSLIAERLRPERDPSRPPVFQVSFVLQKAHREDERAWSAFALGEEGARGQLAGLPVESVKLAKRRVPFEIVLMMAETDEGLAGSLQFNASLRCGDDGADGRALRCPARRARRRSGSGGRRAAVAHRRRVGAGAKLETAPAAEPELAHHQVERRAAEQPNMLALEDGERQITYGELNRRANQLAHFLTRQGIAPEKLVGVCVERSPELVVGALAVLKAGGAYLPLDPAQPVERLRGMLADSGARVLLTREGLAANFRTACRQSCSTGQMSPARAMKTRGRRSSRTTSPM